VLRFQLGQRGAFADPRSYFHRYAALNHEEAVAKARADFMQGMTKYQETSTLAIVEELDKFAKVESARLRAQRKALESKPSPPGVARTKAEIRAALDAAVARVNVVVPEGEDPFAYTLTALNAPAALKMFASVPDGWTHKEVPSA